MSDFARKPKPLPVSVAPLPKNRGALRAAAEMAAEWADAQCRAKAGRSFSQGRTRSRVAATASTVSSQ